MAGVKRHIKKTHVIQEQTTFQKEDISANSWFIVRFTQDQDQGTPQTLILEEVPFQFS